MSCWISYADSDMWQLQNDVCYTVEICESLK